MSSKDDKIKELEIQIQELNVALRDQRELNDFHRKINGELNEELLECEKKNTKLAEKFPYLYQKQ